MNDIYGDIHRQLGYTLIAAILFMTLCSSTDAKTRSQTPGDPQVGWGTTEWIHWRNQQIDYILEPTFAYGNETLILREDVISRAASAFALLGPILKSKPDYFTRNSNLSRAMGHFIGFISAQSLMAIKDDTGEGTHKLALSIPDVEYWKYAAPYVTFPPLLRSQEFLKNMEAPNTYKRAIDMIERQNQDLAPNKRWIVLPFLAQFIKSVDKTTWGRMLVLIPNVPVSDGGTVDEWVLFSIATPDQIPPPEVESVSIISVYRNGPTTRSYPVDFVRRKDSSGVYQITPTVLLPDRPSNNCYDCHKAAILPIKPELEYAFDQSGHLVVKTAEVGLIPDTVNQRIQDYGLPDFGLLDIYQYGPELGPATLPERTTQFVQDCSVGTATDLISVQKIRIAMNCAKCHDDFAKIDYLQAVRSNRDVLAFSKLKQGMVQIYIEKGWMPPGIPMTTDQRHSLWNCLMKEYFDPNTRTGVFIDWLKGKDTFPGR
jgi:hypothetical protein